MGRVWSGEESSGLGEIQRPVWVTFIPHSREEDLVSGYMSVGLLRKQDLSHVERKLNNAFFEDLVFPILECLGLR